MATNGVRMDKKRKASGTVKGKYIDKAKKARTETPKVTKPVQIEEDDDMDDISSDSDEGGVKIEKAPAKSKKSSDGKSGKSFEKGSFEPPYVIKACRCPAR